MTWDGITSIIIGMVDSLSESVWRRGWSDTKRAWTGWLFVMVSVFISIGLFLFGLFVWAWYWGVGFAVLPLFCTWAYGIITAPYKQRNEARKRVVTLPNEGVLKLKGKFFHDFDNEGYVRHQGQIVDVINEAVVAVRYFDWVVGEENATKMVWLREIVEGGWELYSTDEEMRDAYERGQIKSRR